MTEANGMDRADFIIVKKGCDWLQAHTTPGKVEPVHFDLNAHLTAIVLGVHVVVDHEVSRLYCPQTLAEAGVGVN